MRKAQYFSIPQLGEGEKASPSWKINSASKNRRNRVVHKRLVLGVQCRQVPERNSKGKELVQLCDTA
jgi:hypothetical protein